ncbi:glycosyltransferase [Microbacterium sp. MTN4-26]
MTLDSRNYRDGLRLIWISRISPQKRFDLFLRVLRKLHSEGVLDSATAVGPIEPSLESEVNRMAEGLPLDILGERSDVSQFLAEDSVFCLFSHFEGRPFALEEAVASGLPVIASDLPGNRMIVGSEWLADDVDGAVELARRLQTPRTRGLVGRELKDRYERRRRDHEHDERAISDLYSRILVKGQVS